MKKKQTDETQTQNETELLYFRELLLIFLRLSTLSPLQPVTWQKNQCILWSRRSAEV